MVRVGDGGDAGMVAVPGHKDRVRRLPDGADAPGVSEISAAPRGVALICIVKGIVSPARPGILQS
jgi:hypothetical protein